jgi:hypothetical protein
VKAVEHSLDTSPEGWIENLEACFLTTYQHQHHVTRTHRVSGAKKDSGRRTSGLLLPLPPGAVGSVLLINTLPSSTAVAPVACRVTHMTAHRHNSVSICMLLQRKPHAVSGPHRTQCAVRN